MAKLNWFEDAHGPNKVTHTPMKQPTKTKKTQR